MYKISINYCKDFCFFLIYNIFENMWCKVYKIWFWFNNLIKYVSRDRFLERKLRVGFFFSKSRVLMNNVGWKKELSYVL